MTEITEETIRNHREGLHQRGLLIICHIYISLLGLLEGFLTLLKAENFFELAEGNRRLHHGFPGNAAQVA